MPSKPDKKVVTVWEGTTHCSINITHSKLKADNIRWSHNDSIIAKDSFEMIAFDEIRKGDAGTYLDEFDLICLEGINSRPFNFSFTMDVLRKLVYVCIIKIL